MNDEFVSRITAEKPALAMRIREFFAELLARFRGESRYSGLSGETLGYINDVTRVAQKYEQAFIRAQRNVYRNAPSVSGVNYSLKKGGKPILDEVIFSQRYNDLSEVQHELYNNAKKGDG